MYPTIIQELLVSGSIIDSLYQETTLCLVSDIWNLSINEYIILKSFENDKKSAIARYTSKNTFTLVPTKRKSSISPKDSSQISFQDSLYNKDILVNVAIGAAGTGKTTLALGYAFDKMMSDKTRIFLSKPTTMVGQGKAFGPVPGDIAEKYAPYLSSFYIAAENVIGDKSKAYVESMIQKGDIQFLPIEMSRGCTYKNCTFILDEAQNIDWHEMNTLMSRIGENSKLILLGDPDQIDIRLPRERTGLMRLVSSQPFLDSPLTSSIVLKTQYRSPICKLATDINIWIKETEKLS